MKTRAKRAKAGLLAQVVEIQRMAQEMAAASIGLRGWEAKAAQSKAKRAYERKRWAWIVARVERNILRDHAEFDRRVAAVLSSSKVK